MTVDFTPLTFVALRLLCCLSDSLLAWQADMEMLTPLYMVLSLTFKDLYLLKPGVGNRPVIT